MFRHRSQGHPRRSRRVKQEPTDPETPELDAPTDHGRKMSRRTWTPRLAQEEAQFCEPAQTHSTGFRHPTPCAGQMSGGLRCDKGDAFARRGADGYDGVSAYAVGRGQLIRHTYHVCTSVKRWPPLPNGLKLKPNRAYNVRSSDFDSITLSLLFPLLSGCARYCQRSVHSEDVAGPTEDESRIYAWTM
ncbi:hypothetical protein OG21DRAFT_1492149 [Imleria badia]|nr:hypothetical protein OG21DRAFT_1492149 [Imleria badia]